MAVEGQPSGRDEKYVKLRNFLQGKLGIYYTGDMEVDASRWRALIDARGQRSSSVETSFRKMMEDAGFTTISDNLFGRAGTIESTPRSDFKDRYKEIVADFTASALQFAVEGVDSAKVLAPFGGSLESAAKLGVKLSSSTGATNVFEHPEFTQRVTKTQSTEQVASEAAVKSEEVAASNPQHDSIPKASGEPTKVVTGGGTNTTTGSTPAGSPPAGGSSDAVSGGSSGGGGTVVGESVLQDTDFTGMPPGAELWKIGNAISVAYQIDPKDPTEGWVYYTFPTPEAFERAFPDGQSPTPRELTQQEADAKGALFIASTNLLRDDLAAGWEEGFMHGIANAVRTSPWLDDDPAVVAELLAATLEGRPVDDDYIKQQSGMNDGQIAYAKLAATASEDELGQYHLSHQQSVRKALTAAGVRNPDDAIVNYMSSKVADGSWSATNLTLQVEAVSNPYSSVTMDGGLAEIMSGGIEVKSLASEADSVKQFVKRWLGPRGDSYSEEFYRSWAGAILDDPNAQDDLTELMKKQRLALFPEYANENLTYEDIATPWKQEMAIRWGTSVNDLDEEVLHKVIRANDVMEAGKILRGEGMKRGNKKVEMQAANEMLSAFGGPVVNPL